MAAVMAAGERQGRMIARATTTITTTTTTITHQGESHFAWQTSTGVQRYPASISSRYRKRFPRYHDYLRSAHDKL